MAFSEGLQQALLLAVISMPLFLLGYVTRTRGPRGVVHGVVDWSRLSDDDRHAAGRFVGQVLYAMGLVLIGMAAVAGTVTGEPELVQWGGLGVGVMMATLVVILIAGLLPYRKRYRNPPPPPHGR